jgi:extradiol dioxygenase family protein
MTSGIKTVIYPVTDLARAKVLYGSILGVEPDIRAPDIVRAELAVLTF